MLCIKCVRMQRSRDKKEKKLQSAFCCIRYRLSVSSPEEPERSANDTEEVHTVSSIEHAMVQVRLDEMIRERKRAMNREKRSIRERHKEEETKLIVMVAMEKSSYDPREDFRESMEQMIVANEIQETKDLRKLLNYYVFLNSEEFRGTILEAFHQVCSDLFEHF